MEFLQKLKAGTQAANISYTEDLGKRLSYHWLQLGKANARFNITAINDEEIAIEKHYLDCLIAGERMAQLVPAGSAGADIGSGGGFPGLVIATAQPQFKFTLIESAQKKAAFLRECAEAMSIADLDVLPIRAEDAGRDPSLRCGFALVTARAVADLAVLGEYALPLLEVGGLFVAMKGPDPDEELTCSAKAIEILGGSVEDVITYELPFCHEGRSLVVIRKSRETPQKYPRRAGMPTKRPL